MPEQKMTTPIYDTNNEANYQKKVDWTGLGATEWVKEQGATKDNYKSNFHPYGIPTRQQDEDGNLVGGYTEDDLPWDYQNPPQDEEGTLLGPRGESLPIGAQGWAPDGTAYWGQNLTGAWNKISSVWKSFLDKDSEEHKAKQERIDEFRADPSNAWRTKPWQTPWKETGIYAAGEIMLAAGMGIFDLIDDGSERIATTPGQTLRDVANMSNIAPMKTLTQHTNELSPLPEDAHGVIKKARQYHEGINRWIEKFNLGRAFHDIYRATAAVTGLSRKNADEDIQFFKLIKDNWAAARMGWSLGVEDAQMKQTFHQRVADGENADLVAMDMQRTGAELIGRVVFDATAILGVVLKGAKLVGTLDDISTEFVRFAPEAVEFFASKGDDVAGALRAEQALEELAEELGPMYARITQEMVDDGRTFGLNKLLGKSKRAKAVTEAEIVGRIFAANAGDADEAALMFQAVSKLSSEDPKQRLEALRYLVGAVDPKSLETVLSEGTGRLSVLLNKTMQNADGVVDPMRFADEFLKIQDTGDPQKMWEFISTKMDSTIDEMFPLLDEAIEQGVNVPASMRFKNWLDQGAVGTIRQGVSAFSTRAYIGTNPGVVTRGLMYDLVQSVVDTDITLLTRNAGEWAELSVKWLGSEHVSLAKGFSLTEVRALEDIIVKNTSYKDIPTFMEALKGGAKFDFSKVDSYTLPMARLLERLEISSGQRLIGHASDEAMRKLLGQGLKNVDGMVQAGLDPRIAKTLANRVIGQYGDSTKVKNALLTALSDGEIELWSDGSWIADELIQALDIVPGSSRRVKDAIAAGKPLKETVADLRGLFAETMAKTDRLKQQHVQAVVEAVTDTNPDNMVSNTKKLLDALEDGVDVQHVVDEALDVFVFTRQTKNAWMDASTQVLNNLKSVFQSDAEALAIINKYEGQGLFRQVGNAFAKTTVENQGTMDMVASLTKKLKGSKAEDIPAILDEIKTVLKIDWLPSDPGPAVGRIWEIMKSDRQKVNFIGSRRAAQAEFDKIIQTLIDSGLEPDKVTDIVNRAEAVKRAEGLETLASLFDHTVWVNGELKSAPEYMRYLFASGNDNSQLVRTIASYTGFVPGARPTSRIFDAEILAKLQDFGVVGDTLDEVDPEAAYRALQEYRDARGLTRQADELVDILGNGAHLGIPEEWFDIRRNLQRAGRGQYVDSNGWDDIFRFVEENGSPEDKSMVMEALHNSEGRDIEKVAEIAQRVFDESLETANDYGKSVRKWIETIWDAPNPTAEKKMRRVYRAAINGDEDELKKAVDALSARDRALLEEGLEATSTAKPSPSLIPPHDGQMPTEARHIWENRHDIKRSYDLLINGLEKNYGKVLNVDNVSDDLLDEIVKYFDNAEQVVQESRIVASKYAQQVRDFALHDYDMRYGIDGVMAYLYNFHFWPSRTASKWLGQRMWQKPALVSAYMNYRDAMQDMHKESPDWWKYSINSNDMLGLDSDKPWFFRLENTLQPVYFMAGSDFKDDKKRVDWFTSLMDDMGRIGPGYWNPLIQYALVVGLKQKGEHEAASHWAGRMIPATQIVKSITSLMGVNEGRGAEVDPGVLGFSGGLEPFERQRVARTLATYALDGDYTEEEILEAALNQEGEIWDKAMADQMKTYAPSNLMSTFSGVNSRMRTYEDLETERFWGDYTQLWAMYDNMSGDEFRYNMEKLRNEYPFMDALLLGRKGGQERSEAYVWNVLSRIQPGKTDDVSEALGLPYDLIGKWYDDKGDTSEWSETDRELMFNTSIDLGASLALPDQATRLDWAQASMDYSATMELGKELFDDEIWDRLDMAYVIMDEGLNGSVAFQKYLNQNPDVQAAIRWKEQQIMANPNLQAYYMSHKKLRDYYKGEMYQTLEDNFGAGIWDKWTTYYAYKAVGDDDAAKRYKAQHPDMEQYTAMKKELSKVVTQQMIEFGETLPVGEPMVLREDFEPDTARKELVQDFMEQPEERAYTVPEWVDIIGQEETLIAKWAYEGLVVPDDIRDELQDVAISMGMSFEDLLRAIGTAPER